MDSSAEISEREQYKLQSDCCGRNQDSLITEHPRSARRFSGWRFGTSLSALLAGLALAVNITWTIWAVARSQPDGNGGLVTIFEGDCSKVKKLELWLHLIINALSTLLLGASNYTQQSLVAPTRDEIDAAHKNGKSLAIGRPSFRNLFRIDRRRTILWLFLSLSSIPLHLVYNSSVFSTTSASQYHVYLATNEMFQNSSLYQVGNWKSLGNAECISAFQREFVSDWADVVLIASDGANKTVFNISVPLITDQEEISGSKPYYWMCNDRGCHQSQNYPTAANWTILTASPYIKGTGPVSVSVSSCYVRPAKEHCKVQLIPKLMVIIVVCNAIKLLCICITFWRKSWRRSLVTVGDAVASFLQTPDPTTRDACLYQWEDFDTCSLPRPWEAKRRRWFRAASVTTWVVSHLLFALIIGMGSMFLAMGMSYVDSYHGVKDFWDVGFGATDINQLLSFNGQNASALVPMILLANTPQVGLSFLYLFFNGILSSMLLEREWHRFGLKRQFLRVSNPIGNQRSTHFLSLPKIYAIPLAIFFTLLHWILSQSIFLVRVDFYDPNDQMVPSKSITTCGYSSIAIMFCIVVGGLGIFICFGNGLRRFRPGMPIAAGCSAVISAACHRPESDSDAAFKMVMWGVVREPRDVPGHCCITSFEVGQPVEGLLYA